MPTTAPADRRRPALAALLLALGLVAGCRPRPVPPPEDVDKLRLSRIARHESLRRARVWRAPEVPPESADLGSNGPGGPGGDRVECTFVLEHSAGMTPKFHCVLPDGRRVKVKYGRANAETVTELAATRLLRALGFGADHVYAVPRLSCRGCPLYPYPRLPWFDALRRDPDRVVAFEHATVELPFGGAAIEAAGVRGWGFNELAYVDPRVGGAGRDEVDALRLMAAFLANWDLKYENQRLACLEAGPPGRPCRSTFALMHDVGVSFGPWRLDVNSWDTTPVFADPRSCALSMKSLPYQGATFGEVRIGERGRRLLGGLLSRLTRAQLAALFAGAGVGTYQGHADPASGDPERWVRAFEHRVRQVTEAGPCPLE